jgi:hypothetical protein
MSSPRSLRFHRPRQDDAGRILVTRRAAVI